MPFITNKVVFSFFYYNFFIFPKSVQVMFSITVLINKFICISSRTDTSICYDIVIISYLKMKVYQEKHLINILRKEKLPFEHSWHVDACGGKSFPHFLLGVVA